MRICARKQHFDLQLYREVPEILKKGAIGLPDPISELCGLGVSVVNFVSSVLSVPLRVLLVFETTCQSLSSIATVAHGLETPKALS